MKVGYDALAREYAQHRQVQPEVLRDLIQTGELDNASQVLDVGWEIRCLSLILL